MLTVLRGVLVLKVQAGRSPIEEESGQVFDLERYMPFSKVLLSEPFLVGLWIASDVMIVAACLAIPFAAAIVVHRRPDFTHRGLVTLFAVAILLCGLVHVMDIVTLTHPFYPLAGLVKLVTGLVAILTAIAVFRIIPTLVQIPSADRHQKVIEQLEMTLADLSQARDQLESRVKHRTEELRAANMELAFTAREAVERSCNLIEVVSSLTDAGIGQGGHPQNFLRELRGRIDALALATTTVMEQSDMTGANLEYLIRRQGEPFVADPVLQLDTTGPQISTGTQGAQAISLVIYELGARFARLGRDPRSRGRIAIRWAINQQSGRCDEFTIEWRETFDPPSVSDCAIAVGGDGTDTPEPLADFSETLLTRIVPRLLDGKGRIDVAPATFIYRLTCPLAALENPQNQALLINAADNDDAAQSVVSEA